MTNPSTFFISFLFFLISHLLTTPSLISAGDPLFISCQSGENYTSASSYERNLRGIIANLISTTPNTENLFFEDTFVGVENQTIFGLAQCRPDKSAATCSNCLERAAALAVNDECQGKKSASVRNEFCVLLYDNRYFFSSLQNLKYTNLYRSETAKNEVDYGQQVVDLLEGLLEGMNSAVRIAVGSKKNDMNGVIYGMAWCTMDLSSEAFQRCLRVQLSGYESTGCAKLLGGGSVSTSCIVTYNNEVFFDLSLFQAFSSSSPALNGTVKR